MTQQSAHKSIWQTTDAMIIIALVLGFVFNNYIYSFSDISISSIFRFSAGGLLLCSGLFIIILAKKEFSKLKQPSGPGKPTTKIVDSGIFKFSRNPLYLGILIIFVGIGISSINFWYIILSIPLGLMIHFVLVLPEEHYLSELFGQEYESYTKRVRRWI